jgi:hypothetical protein
MIIWNTTMKIRATYGREVTFMEYEEGLQGVAESYSERRFCHILDNSF